jgi:putative DNA primase/helicase
MIDWQAAKASGRAQWRTACPVCDKGSRDIAVSVDTVGLQAICHRCESTFFPDGEKIERREIIDTSEKDRWVVEQTLCGATPISRGDAVYQYLAGRLGCELDYLPAVHFHPALRLYEDGGYTVHPAMVVPFIGPTGDITGIHRTWLTPGGHVRRWKGIGNALKGSALRLYTPTEVLAIAEGIETALAVKQITADPVWAVGSASMLKAFVPPPGVKRLLIAGDNDTNRTGQKAAWALYHLMKKSFDCTVLLPGKAGTDWLDEWRA